MTKNEAEQILSYVANNILSPMYNDNRPAQEVWKEMIGTPFNNLCKMVHEKVEKSLDKSPRV